MTTNNPYEGEWFAFEYCTDRMEEEGSDGALAILRVEEGKLVEKFNPEDAAGAWGIAGERETEKAFQFLKEKSVKKVYSKYNLNPQGHTLFGWELGTETPKDLQGEELESATYPNDFVEYVGVFDGHSWAGRFKDNEIELKLYAE